MKDMCKENQEKFAIFPKGVHGFEIPRFCDDKEDTIEYWKKKADYIENPKFMSQKELL
jgi:hypothetical protein